MSAQITSTPDELLVVNPNGRSLQRAVLALAISLFVLWQWTKISILIQAGVHSLMEGKVGLVLLILQFASLLLASLSVLFFMWIVLQSMRPFFGSRQILRCTRNELELTSIDFGHIWRKRTFAREDIRSIAFGAVSVSKYGATNGLLFRVHKKQIKALPGLRAREAKAMLEALFRLGFDTFHDPAMKMVIEIEESRSRFWG